MDLSASGKDHGYAPSHRGGSILVSLYSWTCITVGVVIARLSIGCLHKVEFGPDDAAALLGSVVYLGATVSWQIAVNAGLGKDSAEATSVEKYFKATYAAHLLQIAVMALAKYSSAFLLERVAPQTQKERALLFGMVTCWFIYSVLAVGLQCGIPKPWELLRGKCAFGGLFISVIVLNMLSDFVLAGWILPTLRSLRIDNSKRTAVVLLFGARVLVPIVSGAQAWAAAKAANSDNPTWDGFELALLTQAVASLSLIVASLPRIKRFLSAGGGGILYPEITEAEIALSTLTGSGAASSGGGELMLVPRNSHKFISTIMSGKKPKERPNSFQKWHKFVGGGSSHDEHTSTSSLVERQGVMLQQEVTIKVERNHISE